MRTLYEITSDMHQLLDMMLDSECDEQIIADTLEGMQGELSVKLDNYKIIDAELEAQEEKLAREIDRLSRAKASIVKRRYGLKQRMFEAVDMLPDKNIKTDHYQMKIVGCGGKQPMKIDEAQVPESYMRFEYVIDREKIREELEKGILFSFARLEPRGTRLSIK